MQIDKAGVKQLLNSPAVKAEVERRAHAIAAAAGPGFEVDSAWHGFDRAHATVWTATTEARRKEARDRTLTRAIQAGRG